MVLTREDCDAAFYLDMLAVCDNMTPAQKALCYADCLVRADEYFVGVRVGSGPAYRNGQNRACQCCQNVFPPTQEPVCADGTFEAGGGCLTTRTTMSSSCAGGCADGDPCTDDRCVADVRCAFVQRTGLAGAICRCAQPPPAECGGAGAPRSLARSFAEACRTLEKLGGPTTRSAAKLRRRAGRQLRRAASVAARLGKGKLSRACADAWRRRLLDGEQGLASP